MRALGVRLIEHGADFRRAARYAMALAAQRARTWCPASIPTCRGVATYWWSFSACPIWTWCMCPLARARLQRARPSPLQARPGAQRAHRRRGSHATTYADSLAAGRVVEFPVTTQLADGMACRVGRCAALEILQGRIDHIVQVSDAEVADAMRVLLPGTHKARKAPRRLGCGSGRNAEQLRGPDRWACRFIGRQRGSVRCWRGCCNDRFDRVYFTPEPAL